MDNDVPPVGRERDAVIAESCGWTDIDGDFGKPRVGDRSYLHPLPRYSTDLTAAFALGAEAARIGFAEAYIQQLANDVTHFSDKRLYSWEGINRIAHASADARSAAFLAAWREWKGRQDGTN